MHVDGAECVKKNTKTVRSPRVSSSAERHSVSIPNTVPKEESFKKWNTYFWEGGRIVGTEGVKEVYKKCWRLLRPCFLWFYFCRSCLKIFCTVLFYQCVLESVGWLISQCVFCLRARVRVCACVCEREREKQTGTGCANMWGCDWSVVVTASFFLLCIFSCPPLNLPIAVQLVKKRKNLCCDGRMLYFIFAYKIE